jgi:hypothetical protein
MKFSGAYQGYGTQDTVTSWGGGVIYNESEGLYHMYVARMANECGLEYWTTVSQVDHAISKTITGPYEFHDKAIDVWSHNPAPVTLPDGTFAIFHIGNGVHSGNVTDCSKNLNSTKQMKIDDQDVMVNGEEEIGSTIHVSRSLYGPWEPLQNNTLPSCNNPAPFVHSNGTIFIVCNLHLYRTESIRTNWTLVSNVSAPNGPQAIYEDPYLYVDHRGHFHLLFHAYKTFPADTCVNSTVSAHAYSEDGFVWHSNPVQPYDTQVEMHNGTIVTVSTRERPKMFFDKNGHPTHLFNGVCSATSCPPPEGPHTGCVDCKCSGYWDYTLISAL